MIFYPDYLPPKRADIVDLFTSQRAVRLVTLDQRGAPRIGLYPFLAWAEEDPIRVEVHMVRGDAQAQDLARDPRCAIEVDEVLSYIPSHWQEGDSALHADLYYRFAAVTGTAQLGSTSSDLATHLAGLLARYQPEGRHQPVDPENPLYAAAIGRLVLVRFAATAPPLSKFKLGQKGTPEERRRITAALATSAGSSERTLAVLAELGERERGKADDR